ncbi:MAG: hypothetical protein FWD30_02065 [Dehalococcoidia bacterium]|nr:hypothetical protein [Dehalococcoidia bacterium]
MWFLLLLLALSVLAVVIWIYLWICGAFAKVATAKGCNEDAWKIISLLGMAAWLLVIALPNKAYHEELLDALRERQGVK